MPAYEFECLACGAVEDHYRSMAERNNAPDHCGVVMRRNLVATQVAIDYPAYRAVAADKETGKRPWISGKKQHQEFLKRNNYEPTA